MLEQLKSAIMFDDSVKYNMFQRIQHNLQPSLLCLSSTTFHTNLNSDDERSHEDFDLSLCSDGSLPIAASSRLQGELGEQSSQTRSPRRYEKGSRGPRRRLGDLRTSCPDAT